MKLIHEEYLKALQTLKDYAPDKFLEIQEQEANNTTGHEGLYLIRYEGYFQLASALTGELLTPNMFIRVHCENNQPLTVVAKYLVKPGEIVDFIDTKSKCSGT